MVFKVDGSSHRNGINGEHKLIHMINTDPRFLCVREKLGKLEHRGGTKITADAVSDTGLRISIKTKNSDGGSFDWLNKSYIHEDDGSKELLNDIKQYYKTHGDEEGVRCMINKLSNMLLRFTNVKKYMDHVVNNYDCDYICINFAKKRHFVMFHKNELKELFGSCEECIKPDKTNTSCKVPGSRNLRIRLVLNNGVKAILTKSSTLCVKLQQDKPLSLEKFLRNPIVIDY
jgi:6-pyruvoyl-tetrahydropterin synthase